MTAPEQRPTEDMPPLCRSGVSWYMQHQIGPRSWQCDRCGWTYPQGRKAPVSVQTPISATLTLLAHQNDSCAVVISKNSQL